MTKQKDWKGDNASLLRILSVAYKTDTKRVENDYYATPQCVHDLLKRESFSKYICEPAVGGGHIANVLKDEGYDVIGYDIVDRGFENTIICDFMSVDKLDRPRDIITNPPYSKSNEFVQHMLDISSDGTKIAMLLKIQFLETKKRYEMFKKHPPKRVYVYVSRVCCLRNGEDTGTGSACCYCWFVFEKGFKGKPTIDWIE